jgi:hypothetical protein
VFSFLADAGATFDVGPNLTVILLAVIAGVPGVIAAYYSHKAAKATDATSNIAAGLNGAFDSRVRNAIRTVTAEPADTPIEPVAMPSDPIASTPPPLATPTDPAPPPAGGPPL